MATPTLNDQAVLAKDAIFISRVQQALVAACISITNEATSAALHYKRAAFATQVLNNPTPYSLLFAFAVATDPTVIANVTGPGTLVGASQATIDTQQALATDTNINNAVSSSFNSFFSPI
jgi:hypothetical protein